MKTATESSLVQYGLTPEYGRLVFGDLVFIATEVELEYHHQDFCTMKVMYRCPYGPADGDLRFNARGFGLEDAVRNMKQALDFMVGRIPA